MDKNALLILGARAEIAELREMANGNIAPSSPVVTPTARRKRRMSRASRKAIGERMKAYWA